MAVKFPGSQATVYVMREVTYGVPRKPAGAEAVRTISETFTPAHERAERPDRTSSADYIDQYTGRHSATWELQALLLPNGNVATQPDDFRLWEDGLGHMSIGVTSIEFLMATAHTTSLTIRRGIRGTATGSAGSFQEHVFGAIVQGIDVAWGSQGQNGLATVTYRGMAKKWGYTGNSSLDITGASMTKVVSGVTVYNSRQFTEGSCIQVKTDVHGASGFILKTSNFTNNRLTFSLGCTGMNSTHSEFDSVWPHNPVPITAGSPVHAKVGYLSLDGSATQVKHLGGRITFDNGRTLLADEVGFDSATEVLRDTKYKTTVSLEFLMKKDQVGLLLGSAYDDATSGKVHVGIGSTTGGIYEFQMKRVKWDIVAPNVPAEGDARVTMTGRAYGINGQDSLKVRIK
jgi:hypothetical protein